MKTCTRCERQLPIKKPPPKKIAGKLTDKVLSIRFEILFQNVVNYVTILQNVSALSNQNTFICKGGGSSCKAGACISGVQFGDCGSDVGGTSECEVLLPLVCKKDGLSDTYNHTTSIGCSNCPRKWLEVCPYSCSYCSAVGTTSANTPPYNLNKGKKISFCNA